jgi:hypothetical protein
VFTANGIEEIPDNTAAEAGFLPVVHFDHALPIRRYLGESEVLAEVGKVQDILLEARTAVTNRGLEELGTDARVLANRTCHLVNVRTGRLAKSRDRVDGGNALREESVGNKLGKLR